MERKLALQFVETEAPDYPVMVVPPDILYTFNLKAPPPGNYKNVDSALFFSSKYIQHISDSLFLKKYFDSFAEQSKATGLDIFFPTDLDSFLNTEKPAYIVNYAQMELSEDTAIMKVEEKINYQLKNKYIPYSIISLGTWFEISMKDSLQGYTYFDEQYLADEIFGEFVQHLWSQNIEYEYEIVKMENEDIYNFAQYMGKTHAQFFFDLMLNSYIWNKLPKERRKSFLYLHYNSQYNSIEVAEEAFIMIEDE